jgi:hydroxymethylpyrimidine/phosphomethylpyrimidine kinase
MNDASPEPASPPLVLAIGGSDPSGGAGIQADLQTIHANGGRAITVVTSITAQNTRRVVATHDLPGSVVRAQLDAALEDFRVAAVKTGMLGGADAVSAIVGALAGRGLPLVVDPVVLSSSGFRLLSKSGVEALVRDLLPLALVCTPNRHEAELLSGIAVHTPADAERAARRIQALGPRAVVVKGGHLEGALAQDLLLEGDRVQLFPAAEITPGGAHGTGCVFAAALATWLARGAEPADAVARAKAFVTDAIRHRLRIGQGEPIVNPLGTDTGGEARR